MSNNMNSAKPWASFCMSTYKRPSFLETQIRILLNQTFSNFEIVISDNDAAASGKHIVDLFNDERIKYECNSDNLGMIKSYNRSIDRAVGDFIVMVTDDDPVHENMLEFFYNIYKKYPNFSLYGGVKRLQKEIDEVEIIDKNNFLHEILDNHLTTEIHWSSFILKRTTLLNIGKLADYGSGHLVDHALLSIMGSQEGAILINQKFSSIQLHETNYSKANFENYYLSSVGFYNTLTNYCERLPNYDKNVKAIINHLHNWFIISFFNLRKFYTLQYPDKVSIIELDACANKIMMLPYMKTCKKRYEIKKAIFNIKKIFFTKGDKL